MAIPYELLEYHLADEEGVYRARVQPVATVSQEQVVDHMVQQGSTVGRVDILGVLESFHSAVEYLVLDGNRVVTDGAIFGAVIKGTFEGPEDQFDPERHRIVARVTPGRRYRQAIAKRARAVKRQAVLAEPIVQQYVDVNSGTRNQTLTPGGIGQVLGGYLKFDAHDPQQGIFFLDADGEETRAAVVAQNKPGQIFFQVPALPPGTYRLEIRARPYESKDLRSGRLKPPLTVLG